MLVILLAASVAGAASVLGALLPRWRRPSTLVSSVLLGFGAGVMTGTVAFQILPEALRLASLLVVSLGFVAGFGMVYAFDLVIHRGQVAGAAAEQRQEVEASYRRKRPLGGAATVLAGGTLFEAVIEGVSLGVAATLGSGLTLPLAIAVTIDNLVEGLGLGDLSEQGSNEDGSHVLPWSAAIGATTVIAALIGWFVLRGVSPALHAAVFAAGGGGMLYLTVTELVPEAETEHYQESSAVATALGFLAMLIMSEVY